MNWLLFAADPVPAALAGDGGMFGVTALVALATLTGLEIVLGIDNIIFIAILAGKLPPEQRTKARLMGLSLAVISRLALLAAITWVMQLEKTKLFSIGEQAISGKDLVLILGGAFLIGKATYEIHHKAQAAAKSHESGGPKHASLTTVLIQVLLIDVVFSLDSVITAVGLTPHIWVMVAAILISVAIMLALSGPIVSFIDAHPAIKILALAFLILIGVLLVAEGFHHKIPKGYVYTAMAFSLAVEMLQIWTEKKGAVAAGKQDPRD